MNAAVVLQARMGSTRLPGKVLARIAGRTVLEHCFERLRVSGLPVVLATTTRGEDDALVNEAARLGVAATVRGPDDDVLARYVMTAQQCGLDEIVRATADNPAVDLGVTARLLRARRDAGVDHVVEDGLPYGATVEVVTREALERAAELATAPYDREHVTPLLCRDARFRSMRVAAPAELRHPHLRLTVDTAADLEFIRKIVERAESSAQPPVPLAALIAAAGLPDPIPSAH